MPTRSLLGAISAVTVGAVFLLAPLKTQAQQTHAERYAAVQQIRDDATRAQFEQLAGILDIMAEIDEAFDEPPGETRHVVSELAVLDDYDSIDRMTEVYTGSLLADGKGSNYLETVRPFDYPFAHELTWQTMKLSNGKTVPIASSDTFSLAEGETQAVAVTSDWLEIGWSAEDTENEVVPVALQGMFVTDLPGDIVTLDLDRDDLGKPLSFGDFTLTLTELDAFRAGITLDDPDGDLSSFDSDTLIVEGMDADGLALRQHLREWGPEADAERIGKIADALIERAVSGELKVSGMAELEALALQESGLRNPASLTGRYGFRGSPESLRVTLLVPGGRHVETSVDVDVVKLGTLIDGRRAAPLRTTGSVYAHDLTRFDMDAAIDLTRQQIAETIIPRATVSDGAFTIRFSYPDVRSGWFILGWNRVRIDEADKDWIRFYDDDGNLLAAQGEDAVSAPDLGRITYDPSRFEAPPAEAEGTVYVERMISVGRKRYSIDALPEGLSAIPGAVLVHRTTIGFDGPPPRYLALDASGRYLRAIGQTSYEPKGEDYVTAHYFYGDIAEIEVVSAGETELVAVPFRILLPAPDSAERDED